MGGTQKDFRNSLELSPKHGSEGSPSATTRIAPFSLDRFPALRSRDFRLLWAGQGISGIGSFMQMWAINWHLYALTHRPLSLGLIGLFRVIPIVVLSLIGGAVADARDRRKVMLATQSVLALTAALLGILTVHHDLTATWIYAITVVSSAAIAFDNPARQSLIPAMVRPGDLANALSMMSVSFRTSTIIGPVLAGLFIAHGGLADTYFINAISFLAVIGALLAIRTPAAPELLGDEAPAQINLAALKEGLSFVRGSQLLVSTILLDFLATFFSSANSLLPIFAQDILRVGANGYGVLAAAEAVGALIAGVFLSFKKPMLRQGTIMLVAVGIYGFATVVFGASRIFWISWMSLAVVGASDAISTIIRQTIRQLITPNRLRGRMTSVNMIFFMGGPQLGELESGAVAQWLGGPISVIIGGLGCLITVALTASKSTVLREYKYIPDSQPDSAG